jgi:ADP-dependent NAD(P)H-hydrate dehydratase / NAD(P)H-hydrate epimerase
MKIFEAAQIRLADEATLLKEKIPSIDLMERAAQTCVNELKKVFASTDKPAIICGNGNNGGDGLAIARLLYQEGIIPKVFTVEFANQSSVDYKINLKRLKEETQVEIQCIDSIADFQLLENHWVIDALLGTGTSRPVDGLLKELIVYLNKSRVKVISIDLPSGMPADGIRDFDAWKNAEMVNAVLTFSFQFPKLAFFLPETGVKTGEWKILDIGLSQEFMDETDSVFDFLEVKDLMHLIHKRAKFSNKGSYGHLLLIAGSEGKSGAALMSSKAAMRTGCGKLTLCSDQASLQALAVYLPEAMSVEGGKKEVEILPALNSFDAIAVGPGLGKGEGVQKVLKRLLQDWAGPLLVDADAINILAENPTWFNWLPKASVLTPHPLEFRRLTGNTSGTFYDLLVSAAKFSKKYSVFINLKSTYSCLITPSGRFLFNSSGISALAKAGTGDVLSGIIAGFLCMGYSATESICLGNYIHGRAAYLAVGKNSFHSLLAGEIEQFIGQATAEIEN